MLYSRLHTVHYPLILWTMSHLLFKVNFIFFFCHPPSWPDRYTTQGKLQLLKCKCIKCLTSHTLLFPVP